MTPIGIWSLPALASLLFLAACAGAPEQVGVSFERTSVDMITDNMQDAAQALSRSCDVLVKKGTNAPIATPASAWQAPCAKIKAGADVQSVLSNDFNAWRVVASPASDGLFTGYYEATIRASRTRSEQYSVPLYARPADLVEVNLGDFRESLKGQRIAGKVVDGKLKPYADRAAIDEGALGEQGKALYWAADPVAVFFMHIQGSGRLLLDDGSEQRIGFAAQNGHPYVAIGKELLASGALTKDNVSMQSIRAWLAANPTQAAAVMQKNPSYIFFRALDTSGPVGSTGVVLTPQRSLAVDPKYIAYHLPLWLETTYPETGAPLKRVMVAQDTGGAITGPVRGDVFFGAGDAAEHVSGLMKQPGSYAILLPAGIIPPTSR